MGQLLVSIIKKREQNVRKICTSSARKLNAAQVRVCVFVEEGEALELSAYGTRRKLRKVKAEK